MGLTVKEKEHWRHRIEHRIDKKIQLIANNDSTDFFKKLRNKAKVMAEKKLGIHKIASQLKKLERELSQLIEEKDAIVVGLPIEELRELGRYQREQRFREKFNQVVSSFEVAVMEKDESGRQILKLREEKEALLDTVWLATSPQQIRDLWASVTALLEDKHTNLQSRAMEIEAIREDVKAVLK